MRIAQSVRIGVRLMIGLNLLMALGSIWIFMRMAPAIEVIMDRNARSLQACEEMLSCLAMISTDTNINQRLKKSFTAAFDHARSNITEDEEPAALEIIDANVDNVFKGDIKARQKIVYAITQLGQINRAAMTKADYRARQFVSAGAWGVVFMAVSVFISGMIFSRSLSRSLLRPFEEIHKVVSAHLRGDTMRRCTGIDLPRDIKLVFNRMNELLDKTAGRQ